MIDEILKFNQEFVKRGDYKQYVTDKYPNKKLAVLSCMDTRLTELLPAALGLKNGDAVIAHTTCGACHMSFKEFEHHMLERGISASTLSTIKHSGIDLDQWLEGFHDTEQSVISTVKTITCHPLLPHDVKVRGFIIDSVTGELNEVIAQ